jgi:argininosuccinate synthase
MAKKTVVLAYSGGLDTSCILKWLKLKGHTVIAYVADVGQQDDFDQVRKNALCTGADDVVVVDLKREFVTDYIFPAIGGNAVYENRYLLGTALARPVIAKHQVQVALHHHAAFVAHGATGKGNDQVRFEFAYAALAPRIEVISPWKDPQFLQQFKGRSDLIAYAKQQKIDIPVSLEKPFSTDENLMHKSYESGKLEDPMYCPEADMFTVCANLEDTPNTPEVIDIAFKDGVACRVTNQQTQHSVTEPLALFTYLNALGAKHGIGRIDIVENRFIGIKSRGVYETPGGTILHAAHRDIEGIAMDQQVQRLRDMFSPKLAEIIYNGFWFSPEMDFLSAAIRKSQELIDGVVRMGLFKGNARPLGRSSPSSLYNRDLSSMDIEGDFNQADSQGFIRIHAMRLKAHGVITGADLSQGKAR